MKTYLTLLLAFISLTVFSQSITQYEQALQILQDRGEIILKFYVSSKSQINNDLTYIMSIDKVTELSNGQGYEVYAYANEREYQEFLTRNIPYEIVQKSAPKALTMATTLAQMFTWDKYPTYDVYEEMMAYYANTYPTLCDIDTILSPTPSGNYRILVAKISDNVNTAENEPQFLYSSTMHGDETTGFYLMLRLIDYLLSNYDSISQVTSLVNGAEIWICPLANPDGTYYNSSPVGSTVANSRRNNYLNVDLNRNYPDPRAGQHPDGNAWQAETQAFMTFAENHHFNMGANFHGGAEVMNYPWDTWTSSGNPNADVDWWERVCTDYVNTARIVNPSYMTSVDTDGVTEGGDWYVITGGRQDFMNFFYHCREVTIELDNEKTTQTQNLDGMWNTNYQSLLNFIEESLYGIRGIITDSCTGLPIKAKVYANGYDQDNDSSHVYSALPIGNYHKYVNTGTYSLTYSAPGYVSKTITGISVTNGTATYQNVSLSPYPPSADFTADVVNSCSGVINFTNTGVYPQGSSFYWDFGDGSFSTEENPTHVYTANGTYNVKLTIYACSGVDSITKTSYITINMPVAPIAENDTICGSGSLLLGATGGNGTTVWYDTYPGGTVLGTGATYTTPVISTTTTYYAVSEVSTSYTGAKPDTSGGGGYFTSSYEHGLIFDCTSAVRLKTVRMYAGSAGNRTITLKNSSGVTLDQVTVNVPAGESVVTLNLDIPVGTDMMLVGPTNPNLYRNNNGCTYPYTVGSMITINKSTASTNPTGYYYYFYDWTVEEICKSNPTSVTAAVLPDVVAAFSETINGLQVNFTNTGTTGINYNWDFGDGNYSTQENPTHTYSSAGTFTVTLIVDNGYCSDTTSTIITIGTAPNANFSADTACLGTATNFYDESTISTGSIVGWMWDFGDGVGTATTQNPTYIYSDTGAYVVQLIVESNEATYDTTYSTVYVTTTPLANFSYTAGYAGSATSFTDLSQSYLIPIIGWSWNFDDGFSSSIQNPTHVYTNPGLYDVTLIATNRCGNDTATQQINIITTAIEEDKDGILIYPNPISEGYVNVSYFASEKGSMTYAIYSSDGKLIVQESGNCNQGLNTISIDVSAFEHAAYIIELLAGDKCYRMHFVK